MITRDGRRLKKASSKIFCEAELPESRADSQPLEWRKNYNLIQLPLKNLRVTTRIDTHTKDFDFDEMDADKAISISPVVKTVHLLEAEIDESRMRDTIHFIEEGEEEEIYNIEGYKGKSLVTIRTSEPHKGNKKYPEGVFPGSCLRMDCEPGEDDLVFELNIPTSQMNEIIRTLKIDPDLTPELYVELESYSYEVDDALREHYHARDLLVFGHGASFVSSLMLTSKVGEHINAEQEDDEFNFDDEEDLIESEAEKESRKEQEAKDAHQSLLLSILRLEQPLNRIALAVWFLAIAVIVSNFI